MSNTLDTRQSPLAAQIRRIMAKHGLPEPSARLVAFWAYGGNCE